VTRSCERTSTVWLAHLRRYPDEVVSCHRRVNAARLHTTNARSSVLAFANFAASKSNRHHIVSLLFSKLSA